MKWGEWWLLVSLLWLIVVEIYCMIFWEEFYVLRKEDRLVNFYRKLSMWWWCEWFVLILNENYLLFWVFFVFC